MYAAAGGASIANRRKQKRLQLNKRDGAGGVSQAAAARARSLSAHPPGSQQAGKVAVGQHVVPALQLSVGQRGVPSLQLSLPPAQIAQPTYGFHSSHGHNRNRGHRRAQIDRKSSSAVNYDYHNNNKNDNNRHRLLAPPPISPILQFPISPPPLSLESPNSLVVTQANYANKANLHDNNYSSSSAAVAFPFPPPSFLDLRVSPTTSELQAALLIRREKQRLRGGKAVNFRELPSNLATRLIPPLPRYPPRSYVYGCGGQGPGKAAWQGCARPSPLPLSPASPQGSRGEGYKTKQCEAHRRWMKRNRIRDASYCYGSSGEDDDYEDYDDVAAGPGSTYELPRVSTRRRGGEVNAAVNTVLYAGLGTTALGLVVSFVGTGEKGFLSPELRLVGPSLLCAGLLCCLLRVLLCLCLCRCCGECRWRPCKLVKVPKDDKKKSVSQTEREKMKVPMVSKTEARVGSSSRITDGGATVACRPPSSRNQKQTSVTTKFLPIHPSASTSSQQAQKQQKQQQQQTPVPSSSSCSTAKSHKAHELLLSPAQLPE